ncbi:MAG: inositol 2-dehydrogenase [Pseudomonadota bacterium]
MIRIGILGCGRIGQVHASAVMANENATVAAVADAFDTAAQALAARTRAQVMTADDLIASDDVDAVIIGTPTDTHYDMVHAAARAGKAIFCEKPVDLSATRIHDCIKVVEDTGVAFMTAFNRRFDPNFAHLQHCITDGQVGDVEMVTILSRDPSPPPIGYITSSGGIFRDMMIHDFDMARFLLGEDAVEIYAVGSCLVDADIGKAGDVDTAAVTLKTASGKICQISNSRRATYGYDQRIEVHGAKGMLRAENQLNNTVQLANNQGFQTAPAQHFFLERYAPAYAAELAHFIAALNAGTAPNPGIHDGLKAQMMADAATQSLATKKRVVVLNR